MLYKILLAALVVLAGFLTYVLSRPDSFQYERSGLIAAPPEVIFPYISQLRKGGEWSPYEKADPNLRKTFHGTDGQAGAAMDFEGNSDVGSGRIEVVKVAPNESVELRLIMTKPFHADNAIVYKLTPENGGTRFSWSMSGKNGFMGKLISVLIDCDKMIGDQFNAGIQNLKSLAEAQRSAKVNLTEKPEITSWPATHYVFVEAIGPFQDTARASWETLHKNVAEISKTATISGFMALYRLEPQMVYRAGVIVDGKPASLPAGIRYEKFEGGKYARFVLKGSYSQLPEASGRVFDLVHQLEIPQREAFNIEHYVNDPKTVPEDDLITAIMVPTT